MSNLATDDDLEQIQDKLITDDLNKEKQPMKVDNRSIFTIKEQIVKKADQESKREQK